MKRSSPSPKVNEFDSTNIYRGHTFMPGTVHDTRDTNVNKAGLLPSNCAQSGVETEHGPLTVL